MVAANNTAAATAACDDADDDVKAWEMVGSDAFSFATTVSEENDDDRADDEGLDYHHGERLGGQVHVENFAEFSRDETDYHPNNCKYNCASTSATVNNNNTFDDKNHDTSADDGGTNHDDD